MWVAHRLVSIASASVDPVWYSSNHFMNIRDGVDLLDVGRNIGSHFAGVPQRRHRPFWYAGCRCQALGVFGVESTNLTWVWVVISDCSLAPGVEMGLTEQSRLRLPSMVSVALRCAS